MPGHLPLPLLLNSVQIFRIRRTVTFSAQVDGSFLAGFSRGDIKHRQKGPARIAEAISWSLG